MGAWKVMSRRMPGASLPEGVELTLRRPPEPRQPRRGLPGRPRSEQERIVLTALTSA